MKKCQTIRQWMPLKYYRELAPGEESEFNDHLRQCPECRAVFQMLEEDLNRMPDMSFPDPGEKYWRDFAGRVDQQITAGQKETGKIIPMPGLRRAFPYLRIAALVLVGVFLGYLIFAPSGSRNAGSVADGQNSAPVRMTTAQQEAEAYLDQAKVLLLGIINLDKTALREQDIDFSMEKEFSKNMVRRTAELKEKLKGRENQRVLELLKELEMIFMQLANYEKQNDVDAVELIQTGVEDQAILLKIDIEKLLLKKREQGAGKTAGDNI